ncbi:MAG: type 2 isopentenyl-diphosphate Delta-isomerase [Polyangiales bacterium]
MGIGQRKSDHLELCATDDVAFRHGTNLLECVRLVHQSLPDLALDDVDTHVELLGKRLRAPIVIAGMTGGTERAAEVNKGLAAIAERRGYGFGLGSQRAMHVEPTTAWTYSVREVAPTTLVLGNLGVIQARGMATVDIAKLATNAGVDAMCLHMNPAMELIQPEGDRDFRGGTETFARLVRELPLPVVAKETGSGISRETAKKLRDVGVETVDVSGAGGTSWVGVETLRATGASAELGEKLWDWGIPTAASIGFAGAAGMRVIATGGIRDGLDVARAVALGAHAGGIARVAYQAFLDGTADTFFDAVERELRTAMLLVGAHNVEELRRAPRVITGELRHWLSAD